MKTIKTVLTILLLSLGLATTAWGSEVPSYYPKTFAERGTIDRLSASAAEIVIDDTLYTLSMNIKVHSLVTEHSSLRTLKKGMKIGYSTAKMRSGSEQVIELWVLPRNYSPSVN